METVLEKPEVYMHEIRDKLISETDTEVDISNIWKFLQTSNITRQKLSWLQTKVVIILGLSILKICKYSVAILKC